MIILNKLLPCEILNNINGWLIHRCYQNRYPTSLKIKNKKCKNCFGKLLIKRNYYKEKSRTLDNCPRCKHHGANDGSETFYKCNCPKQNLKVISITCKNCWDNCYVCKKTFKKHELVLSGGWNKLRYHFDCKKKTCGMCKKPKKGSYKNCYKCNQELLKNSSSRCESCDKKLSNSRYKKCYNCNKG
jgi:hypothetical protein